jgi:hypothetical protein
MSRYALREIIFFALAGLLAAWVLPGGFWLWMSITFAAYVVLAGAAYAAFRSGVMRGKITRARDRETSFFVHPSCAAIWLVTRHIKATPAPLLNVPVSNLNSRAKS